MRRVCGSIGHARERRYSKRGKNPFATRLQPRGMAGKTPWNRGLRWEEMYRQGYVTDGASRV